MPNDNDNGPEPQCAQCGKRLSLHGLAPDDAGVIVAGSFSGPGGAWQVCGEAAARNRERWKLEDRRGEW